MDTTPQTWSSLAEQELLSLKDVEAVRIQLDGDDIREIHVISSSRRPGKQIVRDVQTLLQARFRRSIDHRVISIAFTEPGVRESEARESEARESEAPTPRVAPDAARAAMTPEPSRDGVRIRYVSVNLYITGHRAQAQVELRWKGVPRMGTASGMGTREGALRLIALATLAAVQEFLDDGVALSLESVDMVRTGRREAAVVAIELLAHRTQKSLVGCCTVEQDAQEAVVLATMSALNRIVGGLSTREPSELVLRPASS